MLPSSHGPPIPSSSPAHNIPPIRSQKCQNCCLMYRATSSPHFPSLPFLKRTQPSTTAFLSSELSHHISMIAVRSWPFDCTHIQFFLFPMLHTLVYRHFRTATGAVTPRGTQEDFGWGTGNRIFSEESSHAPM